MTTKTTCGIYANFKNESVSYDKNDLVEFSDKSDTGSRKFTAHRRNINKKLDDWMADAAKLPTGREPPSRFGNAGPVYKSELLKPLGEAMSTPSLGTSSYLQLLMENDSWKGWFRLSTMNEPRMKWFNDTLTADQSEFDSCCQQVMRELFTMFESDCHSIVTSFEKAYFDYIRGGEFQNFYETKLPECLRANRECALYLVDSLKEIFETWFGEEVAELISRRQNNGTDVGIESTSQVIDINSEAFILQLQNTVGGIFSKLHKNKKFVSSEAKQLIEKMRLRTFDTDVDPEYKNKYMPPLLQHTNRGGLSLIREPFIGFTSELMKTCMELAAERKGYNKQRGWIRNALTTVRNSSDLLTMFQETVRTEMGQSFDEQLTRAFYRRIAEGCMRTYAKYTNKKDHDVQTSTNINDVTFRKKTCLQCI